MNKIAKKIRNNILDFQESVSNLPEGSVFFNDTDNCPVTNTFADGMHIRQIEIPKGIFAIGKIHLQEHVSFLLKGKMVIVDEENGRQNPSKSRQVGQAWWARQVLTSLNKFRPV